MSGGKIDLKRDVAHLKMDRAGTQGGIIGLVI